MCIYFCSPERGAKAMFFSSLLLVAITMDFNHFFKEFCKNVIGYPPSAAHATLIFTS